MSSRWLSVGGGGGHAVIGGLPVRRSGTRTQQEAAVFFQKFNADFDLSAKEGADSLAFISLIEEKLRPALVRLRLLFHHLPFSAV